MELEIMSVLQYRVHTPTPLDFAKQYLLDILGIRIECRTISKEKYDYALTTNELLKANPPAQLAPNPNRFDPSDIRSEPLSAEEKLENVLIEKMTIYLCKMSMHDVFLATRVSSLIAIGSVYVALKICEQLRKK